MDDPTIADVSAAPVMPGRAARVRDALGRLFRIEHNPLADKAPSGDALMAELVAGMGLVPERLPEDVWDDGHPWTAAIDAHHARLFPLIERCEAELTELARGLS